MARNGAGVYVLPAGNPVVTGTTISSTWANNTLTDIGNALTQSIASDGQTTITANIPMAGFKLTGLGSGSAASDSATFGQIQSAVLLGTYVATVGGTSDVITLTPSTALGSYVAGQILSFIASGANTTNVTVNVSGLGAKALTKYGSTALVANDIPATGAMLSIEYDGTRFQLINVSLITSANTYTADNTFSGNNTFSGANTHSGNNTFTGTNSFSNTTTFTGAVTNQNIYNYAATSGTDTYTATLSPAIASYVTGAHYFISFGNANTSTTPTVDLNSIGAKTIVKNGTSALLAGDIPASHKGILVYDGTNMVLANPNTTSPGLVKLASGTVSGTATGDIVMTAYTAYKNKILKVTKMIPSGTVQIGMQVSTDGGSSYDSGAANYDYSSWAKDGGGTDSSTSSIAGDTKILLSAGANHDATTSRAANYDIYMYDSTDATVWPVFNFNGNYIDAAGARQMIYGSGRRLAAQDTDAIRILPPSGTISFQWELYGYS